MSTVSLDTNVLIYALSRGRKTPKKELAARAKILLRQLEEDKASIIIPTLVISELLVPIPPEKHGAVIAEVQRRFFCPSFDLQAATLAAVLWGKHRALPREEQIKRTTLKADVIIVATARVAGATISYSHERKCRRLADLAGMESRDLPTHHENMFIDNEMLSDSL